MYEHILYKTANLYFSCFRKYGLLVVRLLVVSALWRKQKNAVHISGITCFYAIFGEKWKNYKFVERFFCLIAVHL